MDFWMIWVHINLNQLTPCYVTADTGDFSNREVGIGWVGTMLIKYAKEPETSWFWVQNNPNQQFYTLPLQKQTADHMKTNSSCQYEI